MNRTIFVAALRQRLTSKIRLALLFFLLVPGLFLAYFVPFPASLSSESGPLIGLILGVGILGMEISSGVLQLVFSRPIRRWEYVLSRWAAVCAAAATITIAHTAAVYGILVWRGAGVVPLDGISVALDSALAAIGIVSVLTAFSSLVPGAADLALFVPFVLTSSLSKTLAGPLGIPWLARVADEINRTLLPTLATEPLLVLSGISWFAVTTYLSSIALALLFAVWIVNRRELSYATG